MKERFSELINLLSLKQIQILDSHETVLPGDFRLEQEERVNIETIQSIGENSPSFEGAFVKLNLKHTFNFSKEKEQPYFTASYITVVTFETEDIDRTKSLLSEKDIIGVFVTKQLKKTLWPIFRGILLDAMGRHSLQPLPLPWIK